MSNIVAANNMGEVLERVIVQGDLSKLTPEQKASYYMKVCESVGLNPLTKPFEYIVLNGKLTLYALRACTDQLRTIHKVSVEELTESEKAGVFIVTAKVRNAEGRTDIAKGAVNIANLKGDALANALMKAETKAKRRATLSVCGLGMLDETEVETIPGAITPSDVDKTKPASPFKNATLRNTFVRNVQQSLKDARSIADLDDIMALNKAKLDEMAQSGAEADHLAIDGLRNDYALAKKRIEREEREAADEHEREEVEREKRVADGMEPPEWLKTDEMPY